MCTKCQETAHWRARVFLLWAFSQFSSGLVFPGLYQSLCNRNKTKAHVCAISIQEKLDCEAIGGHEVYEAMMVGGIVESVGS